MTGRYSLETAMCELTKLGLSLGLRRLPATPTSLGSEVLSQGQGRVVSELIVNAILLQDFCEPSSHCVC
jgi:hypothetical protein